MFGTGSAPAAATGEMTGMPILVYTYEIVDTVLVSTGTIELPDSVDADGDGDISEARMGRLCHRRQAVKRPLQMSMA